MALLKENLIHGQKPQFGNDLHIAYVKAMTRMAEKGRIDIEPKLTTETKIINNLSFNYLCCQCGKKQSAYLSNDFDDNFNGFRVVCFDCDAEFEVIEDSLLLNKE